LESVDNPDIDIFKEPFDLEHLDEEWKQDLLNGIYIIKGKTKMAKILLQYLIMLGEIAGNPK
jgi:hypothetical protein